MAYRTRSARRISKNTRRRLILTVVLVLFILYATLNWILPSLIDGVTVIKNIIHPSTIKKIDKVSDQNVLAPPILSIPYEATNTATIAIKGYAQPKTQVKIYLDDQLKTTVDTDSSGNFNAQNVELVLGINNIYAKTSQKDQNSLSSKTIQIIFDNQKPQLNISSPSDNTTITGGDKKVIVSGSSDIDAQVFINGNRVITNEGKFSSDVPLNDGDNNINIKAVDKATNTTEINRQVIYKSS